MLKHIVMWKLKNELKHSQKFEKAIEIQSALYDLKGVIPELVDIEVGIDGAVGTPVCTCNGNCNSNPNWDICLVTSFESIEALAIYSSHPEHLKVVELIKENVQSRVAVDYMN